MRPLAWALALTGLAALSLLASPPAHADAGLEAPALLEDHAPIHIDSDADFTAPQGVRGGRGSQDDPYVISSWRINSTERHVRIANTTKAFVVRNLELNGQCAVAGSEGCGAEAGIILLNTTGGSIVHNVIRDMDRTGIYIQGTRAPVELVENWVQGGAAAKGNSTSVEILYSISGIFVYKSPGAELRGNRVINQAPALPAIPAAVRLWESDGALLVGNEIRNSPQTGLNILSSHGVVAEDNRITGNALGFASQASDGIFRYNTFSENGKGGAVLLVLGGWLRLERNDLRHNDLGITVQSPANATLFENDFGSDGAYALALANGTARADARNNWWGAPNGPNINGTGPGTGENITLAGASLAQLQINPVLPQPVSAGAYAQRSASSIVTASSAAPAAGGPRPEPGAPVAVLQGPGQAFLGQEVQFSAASSFDPQGGSLRYSWDLGDGATQTGLRARRIYQEPAEYVVKLTVANAQGVAASASIAVQVTRQPLAVHLLVKPTATRGEDLALLAVSSGQLLGPLTVRFTTDGPGTFQGPGQAQNLTHVKLSEPREYIVGVEAKAGNETATDFVRVQVINRPPVAQITVEPEQGDTRTEFHLSAGSSSDPDGDPLTYTWDLGNGATTPGEATVQRFAASGNHLILLTASDGYATTTARLVLDVKPASAEQGPARGTPGFEGVAAALAVVLGAAWMRLRPRR